MYSIEVKTQLEHSSNLYFVNLEHEMSSACDNAQGRSAREGGRGEGGSATLGKLPTICYRTLDNCNVWSVVIFEKEMVDQLND